METKIYNIEDPELPEIIANKYLSYPAQKIFDNKGNLFGCYSFIVMNNIRYLVHDIELDIFCLLYDFKLNHVNYEL